MYNYDLFDDWEYNTLNILWWLLMLGALLILLFYVFTLLTASLGDGRCYTYVNPNVTVSGKYKARFDSGYYVINTVNGEVAMKAEDTKVSSKECK
jgi:hypothetical protein